jgi:hypothetical protein
LSFRLFLVEDNGTSAAADYDDDVNDNGDNEVLADTKLHKSVKVVETQACKEICLK